MSTLIEVENLEEPQFEWGKKRGIGGKKKDVQFYDSFNYDGVEYNLYDCVYMHKQGEPAYIGKLVKVWQNADKSKKIKVQWFFRPSEISYYLKDTEVLENELFFASGVGIGLANLNPLEAISGKCNVVCISTDSRNPQPSAEEIQMANYVFYRTFDVKSCTISDQMDDTVGGLEVKYVFNRRQDSMSIDIPRFDSNGKDEERDEIACKETKNLMQQLNNVKPDENGDHTDTTTVDKSTLGTRKVGHEVSGEKDKVKDIESPLNQVQIEERVKSATKSVNLDDKPSKGTKSDGTVPSLNAKETNDVQSLILPGKDAAPSVTGATSSNAKPKPKPKLVKNSVGSEKDVKLAGSSSVSDRKLSKMSFPLSKETLRSGHAADDVELGKDANLTKDLKGLQAELTKSTSFQPLEKIESAQAKDSAGSEMDKKLGVKVSDCRERSSPANVVSPNETMRPLTMNVSPNEKPKSGANKDLVGYGQTTKFVKVSSASTKRPLETNADFSKEKSNPRDDACLKDKDTTLAKDKCLVEGGPLKKLKIEASVEKLEDNKNNTNKKLKEKMQQGETRNSSTPMTSHDKKAKSIRGDGNLKKNHDVKAGKLSNDKLPNPLADDGGIEGQVFEVTRRPNIEKSNWIKLSWEEKLKSAHDQGRLLLLQNLDPVYTSEEVEDIIWHAFKEICTARMVQHTAISSPHSGHAFVIFKTREALDRVVQILDDVCLMLPNKRPLVVSIGVLPKSSEKQTPFVGHLSLDRARRQKQKEMKEAVSTSHYSQNNTIEYEMALDWCLLQSKSDKWWAKLYEQQGKELKRLKDDLKLK